MSKFLLPIGPFHPAIHEPEFFYVMVDGENIVELEVPLEIDMKIGENWGSMRNL